MKSGPAPVPPSSSGLVRLAAAALVFGCLAAYANSLHGVFIYDDVDGLLRNARLRTLLPPWGALFPGGGLTVSGRPVLSLSFALNYALGGYGPRGYHVVNLLIHAGACLLLFGIVRRTLALGGTGAAELVRRPDHLRGGPAPAGPEGRSGSPSGPDTALAAAVALVWALHPLQTESVTYIIQRAESLAGFFMLAALYGFIRAVQSGRAGALRPSWGLVAVASCLLGVGTKEVVAVAPPLILLYDRTFLAGGLRRALALRGRWHAALHACWIPLLALLASAGWNRSGAFAVNAGGSPWAYALTQPGAIVHYLALAAWPNPLIFDYGAAWVRHPSEVWAPAAALLLLLAATAVALWKRPIPGFLGAWFFAILAPTSLVPGSRQTIVEHRMYLPLAAVVVLLGAGVDRLLRRAGASWARPLWVGLLVAWALLLGARTRMRNEDYRSVLGLWTRTAADRPGSIQAWFGIGNAQLLAGHPAEALQALGRASALAPDDADIRNNLGNALLGQGRLQEAVVQFAAAARLKPRDPWMRSNYGNVLLRLHRTDEAVGEYRAAVLLRPDLSTVHKNLGVALAADRRFAQALPEIEEAVRLDPGNAALRRFYGKLLEAAGRLDEAEASYRAALRLDPGALGAEADLARVRAQSRP